MIEYEKFFGLCGYCKWPVNVIYAVKESIGHKISHSNIKTKDVGAQIFKK